MIELSPSDLEALPVDERALLVLRDMEATRTSNERTYVRLCPRTSQFTIAEAIAWLRGRAFIASDPNQTPIEAFFITARGRKALEQDIRTVQDVEQIERGLHPRIYQKAWRQFLLGEFEQAVFVSMKEVEIRVRALGGFGDDVFGVTLMQKAFGSAGPLTDLSAPKGEQEGTMFLFAGAYAVLRNPAGHRDVDYDDVTEAAEAIGTASLLMRILDRVEKRIAI
jgi:uncharacterized protein (TIGR02391 family)